MKLQTVFLAVFSVLLLSTGVTARSAVALSSSARGLKRVHTKRDLPEILPFDDAANATSPPPSQNNSAEPASPEEVPKAPYHYLLTEADDVAKDAEIRRGAEFFTEGAHMDVDIPKNHQHELDTIFEREPNVFSHCLLIRDYAEPLRVGSSLQSETQRRGRFHNQGLGCGDGGTTGTEGCRHLYAGTQHEQSDGDGDEGNADTDSTNNPADEGSGRKAPLPSSLLKPVGAIMDRDFMDDDVGPDDKNKGAEFQLNAFAFLQSVAGEVAVVRNGVVATWTSKRKVPIAGYLCTSNTGDQSGPVLYTLPTPCLPTVLSDDGTSYEPPSGGGKSGSWPMNSSQGSDEDGNDTIPSDDDGFEEDDEEDDVNSNATANDSAKISLLARQAKRRRQQQRQRRPNEKEDPQDAHYHVWVGHTKLRFQSRQKAHRFCHRLAEKIAEDPGDTVWDDALLTEEVKRKIGATVNPSVSSFAQMIRQTPKKDWTTGTKSVLVVVMDWAVGDSSRPPNSRQTLTPHHYQSTIFPRVRQAFQEMSYGQFDIDVTVVPQVVRYPRPRSRYTAGGYPFPGLYNGARDALEGHATLGTRYKFDNYDLVYVISPQQAPTGTKGVAWVGAKGAMCNGCEEISENFQVMVAVHELGHNLGLSHASSRSLEYGNVFDWMGNYPDVEGLSYGVGYKLRLSWIPQASVYTVSDSDLSTLNDEFLLKPFDLDTKPGSGDLVGVQVRLKHAQRDVFIGYRSTAGEESGVYITLQDKESPNSELVDCACHSPSQKDARLRPGWTYLDPTLSFVVYLSSVDDHLATVRLYKAPSSKRDIARIRARATFTDGTWKCPRTCTDSDLLVSVYNGCGPLAQDGYCRGGSITMGGSKYSIDEALCPVSCDKCSDVLAGPTLVNGGCADRDIAISGLSCRQAAAKGYCSYTTNMGSIGTDLCPSSCGHCPPRPAPSHEAANFQDPTPDRRHGSGSSSSLPVSDAEEKAAEDEEEAREDAESDAESDEETGEAGTNEETKDYTCTDDPAWTDGDGDGCAKYKSYIEQAKMSKQDACDYGGGLGKVYCRQTCGTCHPAALSDTCADKQCISKWFDATGQCYECDAYASHCGEDFFAADCPATCGMCKADRMIFKKPPAASEMHTTTTTKVTTTTTPPPTTPMKCEDRECVEAWLESHGECFKCQDFAKEFCGKDELFMQSCPRTCKMCIPGEESECKDDFRLHVCMRFKQFGWCGIGHVSEHCEATCGICSRPVPTTTTFEPAANETMTKSSALSLSAGRLHLLAIAIFAYLAC